MNQIGTYNNPEYRVARYYFTGTTTLSKGQALCFMQGPSTTSSPVVPNRGSYASAVKSFPFDVKIPDANNHSATGASVFAGIVAPSSVGFVGPGYIDVIVPREGDLIQVAVGQNADISVGDVLMWGNLVGTNATTGPVAGADGVSIANPGLAYSGAGATVVSSLAASQLGAFAAYTFAVTTSTDLVSSGFNANVISGLKVQPLVQALESLGSSSASTSARVLLWVKFLRV